MKRRDFIALLGGAVASWPLATRAQQPAMPVVGLLTSTNQDHFQLGALHKGLSEGGYVEGRNLAIVYRSADSQFDRLPALAADLVGRQVAVILALGSPVPARTAMAATKTIPIVFAYGGDPVSDKLVASLNRPGGNVTGATFIGTTVASKRLELLREIAPRVTDVAMLVNPTNTLSDIQIKEVGAAAQILGQRFHVINATGEGEFDAAFAAIRQSNAGALVVGLDTGFARRADQLVALAARHKIPAIYAKSRLSTRRRPDELRRQHSGYMAPGRRLCRSYSQGFQTGRFARRSAHQISTCYQSENRQGAWPRRAGAVARPRRRGDRIKKLFVAVHESGSGPKPTFA